LTPDVGQSHAARRGDAPTSNGCLFAPLLATKRQTRFMTARRA